MAGMPRREHLATGYKWIQRFREQGAAGLLAGFDAAGAGEDAGFDALDLEVALGA